MWGLRYEVADWAESAIMIPDAHVASFGVAALLTGFLGDHERYEALGRARLAVGANAGYYETFHCWSALYVGLARSGRIAEALEWATTMQCHAMDIGDVYGDAMASATYALRAMRLDPSGAAELAARAEKLSATSRNAVLRIEVLSALTRYYALIDETARGVACCGEAIALAEEHHVVRGIHNSRNALAQLLARSGSDEARPALHTAIAGAHADRAWYDLWPTMPVLAEWWARRNQIEDAAVMVGFLDSHHLVSVDDLTRQRLGREPEIQRALERGARMDGDQLVTFALESLAGVTV